MCFMMPLADIKISDSFLASTPSQTKMKICEDNYNQYKKQDRFIVINNAGYLIDGYIMYCVLKNLGVPMACVQKSVKKKKKWFRISEKILKRPSYKNMETTYIFATHKNNPKEYVWRVPTPWDGWADDIVPGDYIYVRTQYGIKKVQVTRIETLSKPPIDGNIRKVVGKEKYEGSN